MEEENGETRTVEITMNVPCTLCFVCSDETEQPIPIQELADSVVPSKKANPEASVPCLNFYRGRIHEGDSRIEIRTHP